MTRDWIWGWAAGVPASILIAILGKILLPASVAPEVAAGMVIASALIVAISILYWRNQASIATLRQAGKDVELIIRPWDAAKRAIFHFPWIFGLYVLLCLIIVGPPEDWFKLITLSAALSTLHGLTSTAYRKQH